MKIINEPTVYLLGTQRIDDCEMQRFLADHDFENWSTDSPCDAETLIEVAARTCYQSFGKGRNHADHLKHLLDVGHGSCIEHAVYNFLIVGVSRSLTHELVRHRAGLSPSQLSQRYVDESVAEYVEPDIIASDPELHHLWLDAVRYSHNAYVKLAEKLTQKLTPEEFMNSNEVWRADMTVQQMYQSLEPEQKTHIRKSARQAARSVLPNATETKIFITINARAARHFIEQRGSRFAEPEIRKLANLMLDRLRIESPNLFGDYVKSPLSDGTFEITTENRKV